MPHAPVRLTSPYWTVQRPVDTVLTVNRGRLFYSHYLRVLEARLSAEQTVPSLLLPVGAQVPSTATPLTTEDGRAAI